MNFPLQIVIDNLLAIIGYCRCIVKHDGWTKLSH